MLPRVKSSEIQESTGRAEGVSWRQCLLLPLQGSSWHWYALSTFLCCSVWNSFRSFDFSQGSVWELLAVTAVWQWWAAGISLCPRQGHREVVTVSWSGFLESFPLQGMRCFTWKMGFRHWGSEGWSGGGPVWGWDLPGPSHCLLLPAPTSF